MRLYFLGVLFVGFFLWMGFVAVFFLFPSTPPSFCFFTLLGSAVSNNSVAHVGV